MCFFKIHLQHINVRKPLIAIDPEFSLPFSIKQTGCRWSVRVEDDDTIAVLFQILQGIKRYFVVADRNKNKYFTVKQSFNVLRHNRIHKPSLTLDSIVHINESQAYD